MIKSIDLTKRPKPVKVTLEEILAKFESAIRSQPFSKPEEAKVRIEKISEEFIARYLESYSSND